MWPFFVVVDEELSKVRPCVKRIAVLLKADLFVLDGSPQSFYEDIIQGPASTIQLMLIPLSFRMSVKSLLVYWEPWSVLKISGFPYL